MTEMAKSWQRRICEEPQLDDLTKLEVGTDFVWEARKVQSCPSCGRPGVPFKVDRTEAPSYTGIVHVVESGKNRYFRDYCVEAEFVETAPTLVSFNVHGEVTGEVWPTGQKPGGTDEGKN